MEALGFSPRVSELVAEVTEVKGSNSVVREVRTVGFVVLAVQELLKVFEGEGAQFRPLLHKEEPGSTHSWNWEEEGTGQPAWGGRGFRSPGRSPEPATRLLCDLGPNSVAGYKAVAVHL